ncbi:MAG: LUD domain-containing protein [Tissierellia bacterium]|nr:LUD domain-containing protein [Tissierellia bacterium]
MINLMRTKSALIKNGFICELFETKKECLEYFRHFVRKGTSVGIGGSMTIEDLGIYEDLTQRGIETYWHWKGQWNDELAKAKNSDYYLCSANAVTEDGLIYFVDRFGNRISSVCYGHEKVFLFIGRNKIVKSKDEAFLRAENIAVPLNTRRINWDIISGKRDSDIVSDEETMNLELILRANPEGQDIYVFLINEDLGY